MAKLLAAAMGLAAQVEARRERSECSSESRTPANLIRHGKRQVPMGASST